MQRWCLEARGKGNNPSAPPCLDNFMSAAIQKMDQEPPNICGKLNSFKVNLRIFLQIPIAIANVRMLTHGRTIVGIGLRIATNQGELSKEMNILLL